MALLDDPRTFLFPAFSFGKGGEFAFPVDSARPELKDLFRLKDVQPTATARSRGLRKNVKESRIIVHDSNKPILLVSSDADVPLFWQYELRDDYGRPAPEADFQAIWMCRKSDALAYLSFAQKRLSLELHAEGRMCELMIFLLLFEMEKRDLELVVELLRGESFAEMASMHMGDLLSTISVDLQGSGLVQKFAQKYDVVRLFLSRWKEFCPR